MTASQDLKLNKNLFNSFKFSSILSIPSIPLNQLDSSFYALNEIIVLIQRIIYIFNEIIIYILNEIIVYIFNEIIIFIQRIIHMFNQKIIFIQLNSH